MSSPATPTDGENRFNSLWFKGVEAGTKAPVADDKSRISEGRPLSQSQRRSSLVVGREPARTEAETRGAMQAGDEMQKLAEGEQVDQPQPSDQAEQQQRVERYRQKLDQQSAQQSYGGYAVTPQKPASGPVDLFGDALGSSRAAGQLSARSDVTSLAFSADGQSLQSMAEGATVQLPATGLASLDIEIPLRGREYLFTTPRGEIEITVHAAPAADVERLLRLLLVAAIIAAGAICLALLRFLSRAIPGRFKALLLLLLGGMSLITGIFPVAGLAVLILGVVLMLRRPRQPLPDFQPAT